MKVTKLWSSSQKPTISLELFPPRSAKTAEKLGKNQIAIKHYRRAIEIEDNYRRQFEIMYPNKDTFISRLGKEKYSFAKQRINKQSAK